MTLKEKIGLSTLALVTAISAALLASPGAKAMPDPYVPLPPLFCSGGGIQTPWGGYCDGATYPDGTHWHAANGMGYWLPATCTFADGGTTPAPGGCRG